MFTKVRTDFLRSPSLIQSNQYFYSLWYSKKIEAKGTADAQKIISQELTEKMLQLKAIEATQKLAESQNAKVIIIGGGEDKLPLILQQD